MGGLFGCQNFTGRGQSQCVSGSDLHGLDWMNLIVTRSRFVKAKFLWSPFTRQGIASGSAPIGVQTIANDLIEITAKGRHDKTATFEPWRQTLVVLGLLNSHLWPELIKQAHDLD